MISKDAVESFSPEVWTALADECMERRDQVRAGSHIEKALTLDPNYLPALIKKGRLLAESGSMAEGIALLKGLIESGKGGAEPFFQLATLFFLTGSFAESRECVSSGLLKSPRHVYLHDLAGQLALCYGDLESARESFATVISLDPAVPFAGARLAEIAPDAIDDSYRKVFAEIALHAKRPPLVRASAHFALAKMNERAGDIAGEIDRCESGNQCMAEEFRRTNREYSRDRAAAWLGNVLSRCTSDAVRRASAHGSDDVRALFVCGMPRSGTTLLEQILSAHPGVLGLDEIDYFNIRAATFLSSGGADGPDPSETMRLAREYMGLLENKAGLAGKINPRYITNKVSEHALVIGVIRMILPKAHVIVIERDPRDVVFSCFQRPLGNMTWAANLDDIIHQWGLYRRAADEWRRQLPGGFYELRHEDLIGHTERETRRLLEYLDLSWDDACLDHVSNERPVRTASQIQVRRPISADAVGRWKKYYDFMPESYKRFVDEIG